MRLEYKELGLELVYLKDAIKEQYYPVGSYDDLYTKWTMPQERDQAVPDFTNIFHTLHTKLGI